MLQLNDIYNLGLGKLSGWKNRYALSEYPEKVVINLFYNQFSMLSMWDFIESCFDPDRLFGKYSNYNEAQEHIAAEFAKQKQIVLPHVKERMENEKYKMDIRLYKDDYDEVLTQVDRGNYSGVSKIESDFMLNFITNNMILQWAALGATGISRADGYGQLTGFQYDVTIPPGKTRNYGSDLTMFKIIVQNIVAQNPPSNFL
jgi:hypothetical protein